MTVQHELPTPKRVQDIEEIEARNRIIIATLLLSILLQDMEEIEARNRRNNSDITTVNITTGVIVTLSLSTLLQDMEEIEARNSTLEQEMQKWNGRIIGGGGATNLVINRIKKALASPRVKSKVQAESAQVKFL